MKANGGDTSNMWKAIASTRPDLPMKEIKDAVNRWWDAGFDDLEGTAQ